MRGGRVVGVIAYGVLTAALWCDRATALPDHPIITEVYRDPPGLEDGPVNRPPTNEHQSFIEIYIPPASALDSSFDKDALRLTFYEVEGDTSSTGTELVNYRFDLPTFDLDPSNGMTSGAIERPSSGVVVLGWVDYVGDPPSALAGTRNTRLGLVNGGITSEPNDYLFIAINGHHFSGTTNFPVLVAENLIDLPSEAFSGVIQNGSGAYLLVDRDSAGYVELCDDKHAFDCAAGADPVLPNNSVGLSTTALLDGFATNDDGVFKVDQQPFNFDPTIDLATVLPSGGAFSLLIAQIPEEEKALPAPGIANGMARVYVDVAKSTETEAPDDPALDAVEAYRHVRNNGPFFPSPGYAALSTSAPELGVALEVEQSFEILTQTTPRPGLLCANVGGDFEMDISASGGTSSNPSVATFAPGPGVSGIPGQSFGFPGITVTLGGSAMAGATASATITVTASNTAGGPPVVAPVQVTTVTTTVVNPTQGMTATGLPFQATVFVAVQAVPASGATNELLDTTLGEFVATHLGGLVRDTMGNGALLTNPLTNLGSGLTVQAMVEEFPAIFSEYIELPGAPGTPSLVQTVLQSAEVQSGADTYADSFNLSNTALKAIRLNTPDTQTFGGTFTPSENIHFVDAEGFVADARSGLTNVTTTRTFELVIVDTNVRSDNTLETGATDDFGIIVEVLDTEPTSSFSRGEFIFLSYSGGLQGADIDTLDIPPGDNVVNLIYLDLDNLHTVLGVRSVELIVLIDGGGNGELDVIEVFSLNPVDTGGCTTDSQCDDLQFCNGIETCVAGSCRPGSPIDCADGVNCTLDLCDEGTESCNHIPTDGLCNNFLFCDGVETCDPVTGCQAGIPEDCDDGFPCTTDSCDAVADACVNIPDDFLCDNGLFCDGQEVCDPMTGCQPGDPPCSQSLCDEAAGECDLCQNNGECDDDNECTIDLCANSDCSSFPLVDGTPCAGGTSICRSGECVASCTTNADCDDSQLCTFDLCVDNACVNTAARYADVAGAGSSCGPDGDVSLFDILAVLNGFQNSFASPCDLSNIDIAGDAGTCPPNGVIDLIDILAVLNAFQGGQTCCPAR